MMAERSDLKELLLLELECPVCTSSMIGRRLPQVMLVSRKYTKHQGNAKILMEVCLNGHACCSYCCPRLPFCPTCRNTSGWARCLTSMEYFEFVLDGNIGDDDVEGGNFDDDNVEDGDFGNGNVEAGYIRS